MAKLFIGTSGWMYKDWQGKFYPEKLPQRKWLEYYGQHFKTVEVNSTFYHSMKLTAFENWFRSTPDDFVFAVKASRFITHIKRLKPDRETIKNFIESVTALGDKLGTILWQLPPRFKAEAERLEAFLVLSSGIIDHSNSQKNSIDYELRTTNSKLKMAFEFRDPSWFNESIYQILRKHNAALVIAESGGYWPYSAKASTDAKAMADESEGKPFEEVITADFVYLRFHGEGGTYSTSYTDQELEEWSKKIKKWQRAGIDVYAYFNNDVAGFAVENAKALIDMVS